MPIIQSQATSSVSVSTGGDGSASTIAISTSGQEATAQVAVTGGASEVSTTSTSTAAAPGGTGETSTTTVIVTPVDAAPVGFTLFTFAFTSNEGTPGSAVVLGGPQEGGPTIGTEYFHNPGDPDLAVTRFDPAVDRFVAYNQTSVSVEVTEETAVLRLSDGATITLDLNPLA